MPIYTTIFQNRSIDYTINGFYKSHVTVFSEVVPVALELSTLDLILEPQVGNPADAGIRGVITLKNPLNFPAEFTWTPILGERGTAFSIRPATGRWINTHMVSPQGFHFHRLYDKCAESFTLFSILCVRCV